MKDKTGQSERPGPYTRAAPMTPGALPGDTMMGELVDGDHWRISKDVAIRVKGIPSKWIETDKHEHLKGTSEYSPKMKARVQCDLRKLRRCQSRGFFPSNAFMASARSLQTFNRGKC